MLPMNGWIKLHRSMLSWEWWDNDRMVKSFLTILLMANAEDTRWHGHDIKAGSFVTSLKNLSERLKLSVDKTRTVLSRLTTTGEITVKSNRHFTLISINNWERYQENPTRNPMRNPKPQNDDGEQFSLDFQDKIPNKSQTNPEQIPDKSQTNPNKQEYRDVKKIEKESIEKDPTQPKTKRFVPPTVEEVRAYCEERGNNINPVRFVNYYEASGWMLANKKPIRSWKACVRTWEENEKERAKPKINRDEEGF